MNDGGSMGFQPVRQNQYAMERSGELRHDESIGNSPTGSSAALSGQPVDMKFDEKRGVYTTPTTNAALAGTAGSGGDLRVSGSNTSTHASNKASVASSDAQPARPSLPFGNKGKTTTT
jgi:hypothetical protein